MTTQVCENAAAGKTCEEPDDEEKKRVILRLRKLASQEEKLKVRTDDMFMLKYLRCTDFNPDKAFTRMKAVYQLKAANRDWYPSHTPRHYEWLMRREMKAILDPRDVGGKRIFLVKLGNIDAREVSLEDLSVLDELWLESVLLEEQTQQSGIAIIVDINGYSLRLFKLITPRRLRIGTKKIELLPCRHIEFHVVNSSILLNASLALVMPFLSARIRSNIHIHKQDWSSLHKFLNPESLPVEYGGKIANTDYQGLHEQFIYKNEVLLAELLSLGYTDE